MERFAERYCRRCSWATRSAALSTAPQSCFLVAPSSGSLRLLEGSSPLLERDVPQLDRSSPPTSGSVQQVCGSVPQLIGSLPSSCGELPLLEGSVLLSNKMSPLLEGSILSSNGSFPSSKGTSAQLCKMEQRRGGLSRLWTKRTVCLMKTARLSGRREKIMVGIRYANSAFKATGSKRR